jgi:hypothetical protein
MDSLFVVPLLASQAALIAAGIAVLGVILVSILKSYRWLAATGIITAITVVTLVGFWPNGQWGISDWDYYFSYHTTVHRLVVEHGVFPQWNPYICGGTSAIGDPEFPLFAPTFLLELLFGVPVGLRLAIYFMTIFGGIGMLLLARRLKLSPAAGLLAAIAFSLGSVSLLEIVEGHPNVFSAFYLPWIFWSWLGAYRTSSAAPLLSLKRIGGLFGRVPERESKGEKAGSLGASRWTSENERRGRSGKALWTLLCGTFLALTFFQGGIYMLMYVSFAFLFLIAVLPQHRRALWITLVAGTWSLGLAAIKLIPVMLWLRQFQDKAYAGSTYILPSLHKILLGRYPHGSENIIPNQGSGWHEYGAYIGIVVLALALASLLRLRHRPVRLLWLGAFLAILIASSGPLLKPAFDQAPFLPRSNISRFMVLAILPLSLLAGYGVKIIKIPALPRHLAFLPAALLIGLATFEITGYAAALSKQAFILQPVLHIAPPPAPIAFTIDEHVTRVQGVDYTRAYARAAAGYGTMSYCSVLGPDRAVRVVEDPEGSPYLSIPDEKGKAQLISWAPNQVRLTAVLNESGEVVVNSNYAPGWSIEETASNGSATIRPADEIQGRLAAQKLEAGDHTLTFTYQAPGLWPGVIVTLLTAGSAIVLHHKVPQVRA